MDECKQLELDDYIIKIDQGVFHKKSGVMLKLHPKELGIFSLLVQYAGQLVTKEQIINQIWHGDPTSDESLSRCIYSIKSSLRRTDTKAETLIKADYGRGYRFIGNVISPNNHSDHNGKEKNKIGLTNIGEIASKDILTCLPDTTVLEATRMLRDNKKSSVLILHNQFPQGIWTEADALNLNFADPGVLEIPICEIMQSPVFSMHENKPITEAIELMRSKRIRHLVVVDDQGKACGVVTQRNIIYSQGAESFIAVKDVKSIAYQNPLIIQKNLQIADLVLLMKAEHRDILIIKIDQKPMYAFTERDLVEIIAKERLNAFLTELEIKPLVTISQDLSILIARQLMDIKNVKHLAVLDNDGTFIKILSHSDILASLENSYTKLLENIQVNNTISEKDSFTQLLASAVHQTAGMMIITDNHGDIKYVNESFEKMTEYTLDEIKGKNPRFLSSGIIHKSVFKHMWETLNLGKTWKGELCNKKKSGVRYWVLSSITPIVNYKGEIHNFIAVEEDITDKKEVEIRLHEIEKRFYEMVDHSLIMIWEADQNGQFKYFNVPWLKFTGRKLQEELGNGWANHLHPDDLHQFLEIFQNSIIRRTPFCLDHRIKNANGDYLWVMNSGSPHFNDEGEFKGFKGACVDVTERKIIGN